MPRQDHDDLKNPNDGRRDIKPDNAPPSPDRGADDRTKPPPGYAVHYGDESGRWFAESRGLGAFPTREQAVANTWAHHDRITAPAEERALAFMASASARVEALGAAKAEAEREATDARDKASMWHDAWTTADRRATEAEARAREAERSAEAHDSNARTWSRLHADVVREKAAAIAAAREAAAAQTCTEIENALRGCGLDLGTHATPADIVAAVQADRVQREREHVADLARAREAGREEGAGQALLGFAASLETYAADQQAAGMHDVAVACLRVAAKMARTAAAKAPSPKSTGPAIEAARREVLRDRGPRCRETATPPHGELAPSALAHRDFKPENPAPPYQPRVGGLTVAEFQRVNVERCNVAFRPLDSQPRSFYAMALAGEVGELCNVLKKQEDGIYPVHDGALESEFGDVLPYLVLLAERCGVDLEAVTVDKFNKVSDRRGCAIKLAKVRPTTDEPGSSSEPPPGWSVTCTGEKWWWWWSPAQRGGAVDVHNGGTREQAVAACWADYRGHR